MKQRKDEDGEIISEPKLAGFKIVGRHNTKAKRIKAVIVVKSTAPAMVNRRYQAEISVLSCWFDPRSEEEEITAEIDVQGLLKSLSVDLSHFDDLLQPVLLSFHQRHKIDFI